MFQQKVKMYNVTYVHTQYKNVVFNFSEYEHFKLYIYLIIICSTFNLPTIKFATHIPRRSIVFSSEKNIYELPISSRIFCKTSIRKVFS